MIAAFAAQVRPIAHADVGPDVYVSTVECETPFGEHLPSLRWETVIIGGPLDCSERRYLSVRDALEGHGEMLALAQRAHALQLELDEIIATVDGGG